MIDVQLLGAVAAQHDGSPVALGGRGPTTLLALLALNPGEVVALDRIIDAVWEGDPPATAVNTVQVYVSRLRRALGQSDVVLTRRPGYVLALERSAVDALRFEDEVAQARRDLEEGAAGVAAIRLAEALSWWRGPVADGLDGASFLDGFRNRLDEAKWAGRQLLARSELARGRHREIVEQLAGWVADAPAREDLWASLMLSLYRSGRQADALEAYRRARTYLVEELGLDPGPELQTMEEAILRQDPVLSAPQSPESAAAARPFVGRTGFLAALDDTLRIVGQGRTVFMCLEGRPGVGLRRMAAEAAARAEAAGMSVSRALAYPDTGLLPGEVARQLALEADVIIVESAHNADGTSLGSILRAVGSKPTLLVMTARPEQSRQLRTFRRRMAPVAAILEITVGPLTTVDLESITDPDAAEALIAASAGVSRMLFPMIDELVASNQAAWTEGRLSVDLPIVHDQAVPGDTRQLATSERRLVEAAALVARPLQLDEVAQLLDADADEALDAVDRLTEHGLLVQSRAGVSAGESVDPSSLRPMRTTELYSRLADGATAACLSDGMVGTYLARGRRFSEALPMLTESGWSALNNGSEGEAFELLSLAQEVAAECNVDDQTLGRIALGLSQCLRLDGASDEAARHLDRAVALLGGEQRIDALGFAAQVADDRQDPAEADRFLARALEEASGAKRGSLLTLHSRVKARLGQPDESERLLGEGLRLLGDSANSEQEYYSSYNRAWLAIDQGRMADGAQLLEKLLSSENRDGRRADLLAWWSRALFGAGQPGRAHSAAEEAVAVGRRVGLDGPVFMATLSLTEGLPSFGQHEESVAAGKRLLGIVLHQLPAWENAARALLARAFLVAGDLDAARTEAELSIEISPPGGRRWQLTALAVSSMAGPARVDLPQLAEEAGQAGWSGIACELLAAEALAVGDTASAERAAAVGLEMGNTMAVLRAVQAGAASPAALEHVKTVDEFIPAGWRSEWRAVPARAAAD